MAINAPKPETQTLSGISSVYDSKRAGGFGKPGHYPIAWEVIFRNDRAGKTFVANLEKAFGRLPVEDGYILNLDGKDSDAARCVECVFKNAELFQKLAADVLANIEIFDEEEDRAIFQRELVGTAQQVFQGTVKVAMG